MFGSDSEGEEEEDEAEVDYEGELVNARDELDRVIKEYKLFKNVVIVDQNRLINCLEEFEKCISELRTQEEVTKELWCEDLASRLEVKNEEYQRLLGEMEVLQIDLEKCKDELKVRIRFDGSSDALDKMLKNQKHAKDTIGLGSGAGKCSTNKNVPQNDILFVSSNEVNKGQTFTVKNAPRKKVDLDATGKNLQTRKKTGAARSRIIVDTKGKGKMGEESFTGSKKMRK